MTASAGSVFVRPRRGGGRGAAGLVATLGAPLGWMVVVYLGSLGMLVVSAFYRRSEEHTSEL